MAKARLYCKSLDQVGRYEIVDEIGRGAHGVVYKALDPAIGRTVAIKTIELASIAEEDRQRVRESILREARLAGTLSHPNIVTVYDVQDTGGTARIFMEFVDGRSLEWSISSTKAKRPDALNRNDFISIFRQVAAALDYAHRKGVIHRDVKPANILLAESGESSGLLAKIADFGVAKFASPEATQSLTGTPNYMSPEQIQGLAVTGACDQFSLACIAYEVLSGRKAFTADRVEALLYRISHEREEAVDKLNPALSQTVRKVMQCAMAKNPQQRFGSCSEFAGALEFALGDSPKWIPGVVGVLSSEPAKAVVPYQEPELEGEPPGRRKWPLALALCVAAGLAIALIVHMNSGPPVTTQVLDTRNAPVSAPPGPVEELKFDRHPVPPQLSNDVPTIVNVPVRNGRAAKALTTRAAKKAAAQLAAVRPSTQHPGQSSAEAARGEIQLLTDPPGAGIVVDGSSSCTTPCSLTLRGGRHTLVANMGGFGVTRKIFYVPADASIFLPMVKSQGVLVVSSERPGANINVDGRPSGVTPQTLHLTPGQHRVSVWDGERWHDENVQIAADQMYSRAFPF